MVDMEELVVEEVLLELRVVDVEELVFEALLVVLLVVALVVVEDVLLKL